MFPRVLSAGTVVGGEYGEGALRSRGQTVGYYSTASASVGLTAGGQSKAVIIMFMTPEAYSKFLNSSGWTAGVDANVALIKVGANGTIDTGQPAAGDRLRADQCRADGRRVTERLQDQQAQHLSPCRSRPVAVGCRSGATEDPGRGRDLSHAGGVRQWLA